MTIETSWLIGLHIPVAMIPPELLWLSNILFGIILLFTIKNIDFKQFLKNTQSQHVYFGAMVVLLLMWGMKAGVSPGLGFHHLGATLFTLMFGWPLAIFGLGIIMLASMLTEHSEWLSLGLNASLSIVIPVFTSYAVLKLSQKYLPDNFFIYVFVVAFFGAGLAVAASRLASVAILSLVGAYPDTRLMAESLLITPLFMFPEMFVTGMLVSIFVVYKPQWMETFDDDRYIKGK